MSVIELRGLVVRYGEHVVFDGLDISVELGEIVAVLGVSGSGKSTMLRCIAGLARSSSGLARVNGEIGFVFQEPRLFPWLTVAGNARFAARNEAEHRRVHPLLDRVGLANAAEYLPKQLSGGMAQRAALARALVRNPEVLLLDEPLAALDALRRIELQDVVAAVLADAAATAVLVTHDVDEALYLADRAIVIAGSPARVAQELHIDCPRPRVRASTKSLADRAVLLGALGVA